MFTFFSQLWVISFFIHHSAGWEDVGTTVLAMLLSIWIVKSSNKAIPFLISLIFSFSHIFKMSPKVANHENYYLIVCFFLILWTLGSWFKNKELSETHLNKEFVSIRQAVSLSLVILYFMAGFHKLNFDFLDPGVSCASDFFMRYARLYRFSESLIPEFLINLSPFLVLFMELIGVVLLLIPRTQLFGILLFVSLHSYLSPLGFYDFASICYAVLICFLPLQIFKGEENRNRFKKGIETYFMIFLIGSVLSRFLIDSNRNFYITPELILSWFFLLGSFYLIGQIGRNLKVERYNLFSFKGMSFVELKSCKPMWFLIMPVLLFIFTNTSYLGLRTAGNASMFSNLRTEGGVSNHLIMSSKWQIFDFQKDLVYIDNLNPDYTYGLDELPIEGMASTEFEFRKTVERWKKSELIIPISIKYKGELLKYEDITQSDMWGKKPLSWWAKKTMHFRDVQIKGYNKCRW